MLGVIELHDGDLAVRINQSLLVNPAIALEACQRSRYPVSRDSQDARSRSPYKLPSLPCLLQSTNMIFGENQSVLSDSCRKRVQSLRERLQVVVQPNRSNPSRRHRRPPACVAHRIGSRKRIDPMGAYGPSTVWYRIEQDHFKMYRRRPSIEAAAAGLHGIFQATRTAP